MIRTIFALIIGGFCLLGAQPEAMSQGPQGQRGIQKRPTVKRYPYELCLVSDDKLGEMGKPIGFAYEGGEIKLCCKDCRNDFKADPARYMKKLAEWDRTGEPRKK